VTDVETVIRSRRTHKAFGPDPVPDAVLRELFELATWSPNHHLTNPWRFRVLGPRSLAALKAAADAQVPGSGAKLARAPTLVVVSTLVGEDPVAVDEDLCASAVAAYLVLLGAHGRGLAGYWRTPAVLRDDAGRAAVGLGPDERAIGLLHLGHGRQEQRVPERAPVDEIASWLP
jgi:nitroreductase